MKRIAQVWSADFAVSLLIFFSALVLIGFAWNYTSMQVIEQGEFNQIQTKALDISDSLIRTSGLPENWNSTNVKVIGLASEENILNETKVDHFLNLDYDKTKQLLGVTGYEFYFELRDLNNTIYKNTTKPVINASIVVPVERYCLLNGEIVKMKFILWMQI